MKKSTFKSLSFIMTFVLFFIISAVPVFALTPSIAKDAPKEGSITINKKGAVFTAYRLLDAKQSGDAYDYSINKDLQGFFGNSDYKSYTIDSIKNLKGEDIKDFAFNLHKFALDKKVSGYELKNGEKNNLPLGYYLILETASDSEGAVVASAPIIVSLPEVSGNKWNYDVVAKPKDNTPSLQKNIVKEEKRVKSSCEPIEGAIKYEVKASIPLYEKNAKDIVYKFVDKMDKGLTYNDKVGFKITSGDKVFENGKDYKIETKKDDEGTTLTIDFVYDNIKDYSEKGLCLNYEATLNEKARIRNKAKGNENNIELIYTNNPYIKDSLKHLKDKVTTYTFGLELTKVDSETNSKLLRDAEFSIVDLEGKTLAKYTYDEVGNVVLLSGNGVTNSEGVTTFLGLKEGSYKIKEEVAPKGYSLLKDPIEIKIEGKKNEEGNYTGEGVLTVTKANKAVKVLNDVENKDGNTLFNLQVENHAGFSLPSTGGLGNTGFIKIAITLLGIVCVLAVFGIVYNKVELNRKK